jgi:hypothetical protein
MSIRIYTEKEALDWIIDNHPTDYGNQHYKLRYIHGTIRATGKLSLLRIGGFAAVAPPTYYRITDLEIKVARKPIAILPLDEDTMLTAAMLRGDF